MSEAGERLHEDLLSGYLDGELTAAERAAVEERLVTSETWVAVLAEITEVRTTVRGLPVPEAPAAFWDTLLAGPAAAVAFRERRVPGPLRWLAGGAAAAVVAVAFVVPSGHHASPSVATLVDSHAARSSLTQEPITQLAPVAQPVALAR